MLSKFFKIFLYKPSFQGIPDPPEELIIDKINSDLVDGRNTSR